MYIPAQGTVKPNKAYRKQETTYTNNKNRPLLKGAGSKILQVREKHIVAFPPDILIALFHTL